MTSPLQTIDFSSAAYSRLKSEVDSTFDNLKSAWVAHVSAVQALKDSKTWRELYPVWSDYCHHYLPYAASTYSSYHAEIPFAELIEAISGAVPTANAALTC